MLQDIDHTECPPAPLLTTNTVINRLSWSVVSLLGLSAICAMFVVWLKFRRGNGGISFLRLIPSTTRVNSAHPLLGGNNSGGTTSTSTSVNIKYTSVDKEEVPEVAHV
jgi:hypothetical protein